MAPLLAVPTHWHGEDVEAGEIAPALARLAAAHAGHGSRGREARTVNLLVAPGDDVPPATLAARLSRLPARRPARTVLVREHEASRLEATVTIACCAEAPEAAAPAARGCCHAQVELLADETLLREAQALVGPLRVSGLPTLLWLPGAEPSCAERALATLADGILLDSGAAADPRVALARAAALGPARVRDLAWARLSSWRRRCAERLAAPAEQALIERVERVELRCAAREQPTALLLTGWLAARAGWRIERLDATHGAWTGVARRRDGGTVALALAPSASTGIEAVALHAGAVRIELLEPASDPRTGDALLGAPVADEEATPGYDAVLAVLREALRTP